MITPRLGTSDLCATSRDKGEALWASPLFMPVSRGVSWLLSVVAVIAVRATFRGFKSPEDVRQRLGAVRVLFAVYRAAAILGLLHQLAPGLPFVGNV